MITYSFKKQPNVRIAQVDFDMLSSEEARRASVVKVDNLAIYNRGLPKLGGCAAARPCRPLGRCQLPRLSCLAG